MTVPASPRRRPTKRTGAAQSIPEPAPAPYPTTVPMDLGTLSLTPIFDSLVILLGDPFSRKAAP